MTFGRGLELHLGRLASGFVLDLEERLVGEAEHAGQHVDRELWTRVLKVITESL